MRSIGALLVLITAALLIQSCKGKKKECAFLAPRLVLNHFSEAESDTIVIRKYAQGTGFSQLLDTTFAYKADLVYTTLGKDSLALNTHNKTFNEQFYLYDWKLVFPGSTRFIAISDVKATFVEQAEDGSECHSYVSSMIYDGQLLKYTTWLPDSYKAYSER